jgi:hypothetical protein
MFDYTNMYIRSLELYKHLINRNGFSPVCVLSMIGECSFMA